MDDNQSFLALYQSLGVVEGMHRQFLPLGVDSIENLSQLVSPGRIGSAQEAQRLNPVFEPADRIDPRAKHPSRRVASQCSRLKAGNLRQGQQAGTLQPVKHLKSGSHQRAVRSQKRLQIRHRGDRHEIKTRV